jgi:hypothetical protein
VMAVTLGASAARGQGWTPFARRAGGRVAQRSDSYDERSPSRVGTG